MPASLFRPSSNSKPAHIFISAIHHYPHPSALCFNQLPHHSLRLHSPLPFDNTSILDHNSSIKCLFWLDPAQIMAFSNLINPHLTFVFLHVHTSLDGAVPNAADSPTHENHHEAPQCSKMYWLFNTLFFIVCCFCFFEEGVGVQLQGKIQNYTGVFRGHC